MGMENLHKNIGLYYQLQSQLIQNLSYNMKCYYTNVSAACSNLENVQKDFEILSLLNSKVLLKNEIINNYKELGIFFKNWRRVLFNQNEIMKKYIRDFYKFIKMEGNAFKELIVGWEDLKKKFENENKRLTAKKEKLWSQMDVSKWEITEDFLKIDRVLLFRDKGYYTFSMHGNNCTMWNRNKVHPKLGYQKMYYEDCFESSSRRADAYFGQNG